MKRLLLPIFVPLVLWSWVDIAFETMIEPVHPPPGTGPSNSDAMLLGAAFLMVLAATVLQLVIGLPSVLLLTRTNRLWPYLATGGTLSILVAQFCAYIIYVPRFGQTPLTPLPHLALVFVPPFLLGYAWAYVLDRRRLA